MAAAPIPAGLILAGGMGLGAYQAGAVTALLESGRIALQAVAGTSIGAMNGAILAGNPAEARVERLAAFWGAMAAEIAPADWLDPFGFTRRGTLRHWRNWANTLGVRATGAPGMFRPRLPFDPGETASLYESSQTAATLSRLVDFDRIEGGDLRFCVAATDVESGATRFWDTAAGDRIGLDHVLASGALLPAFAPVRVDGRLYGDGGLSANAPLEPFLSSERQGPLPALFVLIDLFPPDAPAPRRLEAVVERSIDLKYACQTLLRLDGLRRERALEARLGAADGADLLYLSYRSRPEETASEKTYDLSRETLGDRFRAGRADADGAVAAIEALELPQAAPGLRVHHVRDERAIAM